MSSVATTCISVKFVTSLCLWSDKGSTINDVIQILTTFGSKKIKQNPYQKFQDFDTLGTLDKKVLGDLLEKIHNNFVSEDDLAYFNLQDDSEAVDKYYFDL